MSDIMHVTDVEPLDGPWIRVSFCDGAIKELGLGELLAAGGVFDPIRQDRAVFERVRVNPDTKTVEWPGEVDLDPEVLYGRFEPASGARIERRVVREAEPAAR